MDQPIRDGLGSLLNLPVQITVAYHLYGVTLYHTKSVHMTLIAHDKVCLLPVQCQRFPPSTSKTVRRDMYEIYTIFILLV